MKKTVLIIVPLLLVSFVLAGPKGPQGPKGIHIGPPTDLAVEQIDDNTLRCTWTGVDGATKYAVEACLAGTASDGENEFPIKVRVCVSVTEATALLDIGAAVAAELTAQEIDPATISTINMEGEVRVKAMNPGKNAGPQNNEWAVEDATFVVEPDEPPPVEE